MNNSLENPWGDDSRGPPPPAPPPDMEGECLAGAFVGTISHGTPTRTFVCQCSTLPFISIPGIVFVLFFRCMGAILNRTRRNIRWGLMALTATMFSFTTISLVSYLNTLSISYSHDPNFPRPPGAPGPQPGPNGPPGPPPGHLGFQVFICSMPCSIIAYIMLPLNQWLADGLLVGLA